GIGPAKAEAIVAYREKHGPFKSVDDLVMVQGIGEKTVEMNRESLGVSMPKSAQ
nr:helix-hairpin-helix domain-containing protein [Gammaproteobacteria bacterium]